MIDTTVSLIIGYGLLFISELLPLLPIPQQGLLHTIIIAFTHAATSVSNSFMTNPHVNALDILKDVQENVKNIQQAIPPPVPQDQSFASLPRGISVPYSPPSLPMGLSTPPPSPSTPNQPIPIPTSPPPIRPIPSISIPTSIPYQSIPRATMSPPPARTSTHQMFSGTRAGEYFPKYSTSSISPV